MTSGKGFNGSIALCGYCCMSMVILRMKITVSIEMSMAQELLTMFGLQQKIIVLRKWNDSTRKAQPYCRKLRRSRAAEN